MYIQPTDHPNTPRSDVEKLQPGIGTLNETRVFCSLSTGYLSFSLLVPIRPLLPAQTVGLYPFFPAKTAYAVDDDDE